MEARCTPAGRWTLGDHSALCSLKEIFGSEPPVKDMVSQGFVISLFTLAVCSHAFEFQQ